MGLYQRIQLLNQSTKRVSPNDDTLFERFAGLNCNANY